VLTSPLAAASSAALRSRAALKMARRLSTRLALPPLPAFAGAPSPALPSDLSSKTCVTNMSSAARSWSGLPSHTS